ncbi:MAG: sugar phosphate isomerase/epimerase [Gemmataceae bacterium]
MYVACSTLCFSRLGLDAALKAIRDLHFAKADLAIHPPGPHLTPEAVAADGPAVAKRLKAGNVPFAAFHLEVADPLGPDGRAHLKAVCRLARLLAVPLLTVPPATADLGTECERLGEWAKVASADGVMLTVETLTGTLTGDAATAVELCRKVPGLGLTLDPSHYLLDNQAGAGYDPLLPFVRHVRLRDSGRGPGQFQVRVGQGEVEYGRIITQLDRFKYDRALSVDVRDVPDNPFPVEPEVRKLKYLLESLV